MLKETFFFWCLRSFCDWDCIILILYFWKIRFSHRTRILGCAGQWKSVDRALYFKHKLSSYAAPLMIFSLSSGSFTRCIYFHFLTRRVNSLFLVSPICFSVRTSIEVTQNFALYPPGYILNGPSQTSCEYNHIFLELPRCWSGPHHRHVTHVPCPILFCFPPSITSEASATVTK